MYRCGDKKMSYSIYDMLTELPVEELKDIKKFLDELIIEKIEDGDE
jgi:hypothetical protein